MSDISLAVGDGTRRMTYGEIAQMRRISEASAEPLVRRKGWVRTTGNDGVVRVLVPLTEARKPPQRTKKVSASGQRTSPGDNGVVRTLEIALSELSAQLEHARQHITELQAEKRQLLALLTGPRAPWWRRLGSAQCSSAKHSSAKSAAKAHHPASRHCGGTVIGCPLEKEAVSGACVTVR